ncbi:dodecin domain-containing protein [Streptomyces sp. LZ34]
MAGDGGPLTGRPDGRAPGSRARPWRGTVGSSTESIDDAIRGGIRRAWKPLRNLDWEK